MDNIVRNQIKTFKSENLKKKDESTKKQEKEDQIRYGIVLYSFEDEDEFSHHMIGDKSKMDSLMKNHHDNGILGTDVSTKVIGLGIMLTDLGGTESMKF